jgi:hypothetical protein
MSGEREACTRRERVVRTGKDSYRFSTSPTVYEIDDPHVPTITQILSILRQILNNLYGDEQDNYEALFYALRAAIGGKEARTRDPSTMYFWRGISDSIESLPIAPENLLDILHEAEAYIYHVVWRMLVGKPDRLARISHEGRAHRGVGVVKVSVYADT